MLSPFQASPSQTPFIILSFASKRLLPHLPTCLPTYSHFTPTSIPLPWGIKFPQN